MYKSGLRAVQSLLVTLSFFVLLLSTSVLYVSVVRADDDGGVTVDCPGGQSVSCYGYDCSGTNNVGCVCKDKKGKVEDQASCKKGEELLLD